MPQVASAPVISQPVRSDAPTRTPGQGEPSGAFGDMLDASSAAPDAPVNKPAQAKSQDASAQQPQGNAPPAAAPATAAPNLDLALLVPELPAEAIALAAPPVAVETGDSESPTTAETASADPAKQADDPASALPVAKAADLPVVAPGAPAPPAPAAPIVVAPDPDSGAITAAGAKPAPVPNINTAAPIEAPAEIAAAAAEPLASPKADVTPVRPDPAASRTAPSGNTPAATAALGKSLIAESAPPIVAEQAEAKPSAHAETQTEDIKPESKPAKDGKAETAPGKEPSASQVAAKPAQPHLSDLPRGTDQATDQDSKPATHPQHQPAEHASATARAAVTATHSDLTGPTSVAQTVTAQIGTPPALGLNLVAPLASPLQSFWQPPAQRADALDNSVPISGLAVEIVSRVHEGSRRFDIRLDPPELGRIDVRLDVDRGGNVTSRLTVERAETLDLLRRDAPQLERALQHAGLNTEGGLQFSLRDQSFANRDQTQHNVPTLIVPDEEPSAAQAARRGYGRLIGLGGGVDIRV